MLQPSKQAVVDIFHDDSQFAEHVITELERLGVAPEIRLLQLANWSATNQPENPTLIITSDATSVLNESLRCADQLLIIPESERQQVLERWRGDRVIWPLAPMDLRHRIHRLCSSFNTAEELRAVRESLFWHNRRLDREYELIDHIFRNALSRNYLDYAHIRTLIAPAAKFNGDLCLVTPGPQGSLYVMMADFTGHGLAPATGALPLSQAFFAMAERGVSIAEMVKEFNYRLHRLLPDDMFCACFMLELSASGERLSYWNGGMPPALVYDETGTIRHALQAQHLALGVLPPEEFDAQLETIRTERSDHIALYTDRVIELLSQQHEFLGAATFERYLRDYPRLSDFEQLVAKLESFRGNQPLHDDLSLAILQCCPTELGRPSADVEVYALPFVFESTLTSEDLQQLDVVSAVLDLLGRLPKLRSHRTTVYLLLAEAFNNALEHGLLNLDSSIKKDPDGFVYYYQLRAERLAALREGTITMRVQYEPQSHYLKFSLAHSGEPYDHNAVKSDTELHRTYGRGIELLQQLAEDVQWHDDGQRIEFGYYLNKTTSTTR